MNTLQSSSQNYRLLSNTGSSAIGGTTYDPSTGDIVLAYGNNIIIILLLYQIYPSTSGTTVNSAKDVSTNWVQRLDGGTLYNSGGRGNTGVTPVNINSTKTDLINAYPLNAATLNTLPSTFILKNDYPNIKTN